MKLTAIFHTVTFIALALLLDSQSHAQSACPHSGGYQMSAPPMVSQPFAAYGGQSFNNYTSSNVAQPVTNVYRSPVRGLPTTAPRFGTIPAETRIPLRYSVPLTSDSVGRTSYFVPPIPTQDRSFSTPVASPTRIRGVWNNGSEPILNSPTTSNVYSRPSCANGRCSR
jgi:hypothetical protein